MWYLVIIKLMQGLAKNNNFAGYLNILGFGVPGYTGPALSIFWTGFAVTDVIDVTSSLSDSNPKFFTSFNILPGICSCLNKHHNRYLFF